MQVTRIEEYKSRETIKLLEELLERARLGEILGLVFCVRLGVKAHAMGVSGHYLEDPVMAIAVTARMNHRLNVAADDIELSFNQSLKSQ